MEEKLPSCGLRGNPHIQSRIKALRNNWMTVHDMVFGTNTSGFGWDDDRQIVVVERDVWDAYIKSHPDAKQYRYKPFPHLIDLTKVWGKDRATGGESRDAEDINDMPDEDLNGLEGLNNTEQNQTLLGHHSSNEQIQPLPTECEGASTSRKRKRKSPSIDVIDGFKEITVPFLHRLDKIADGMDRIACEKALDNKREALGEALSKVDGLTDDEFVRAHLRLASDPALLVAFSGLQDRHKLRWLQQIIGIPSHKSTPSSTWEAISGGTIGDGGPIIRSSPTNIVSSIVGCESTENHGILSTYSSGLPS
ncbi:putative myb/SANT-like domain-containing protein [Senna tora]|uniref:Putative myb/SANT-like domain-containing protein n=1 Tax=Senna tora TaxID=362788 RepID=A0A834SZ39_9FABA|nr:putative myb/SANT-like domain-containing protein [Senna tora]